MRPSLLAALVAMVSACGTHGAGRPAASSVVDAGGAVLRCPAGAVPQGAPPPEGRHWWCIERTDRGEVKVGPSVRWNQEGRATLIATYRSGVKHGFYRLRTPDGFIEGSYVDGARSGRAVGFSSALGPFEVEFREGRRHGLAIYYHDHVGGVPRLRVEFVDDDMHGRAATYYRSGQIESAGGYVDGLRSGQWRHWREDGGPARIEAYDHEQAHGTWVYFGPDGQRLREETYVHGARRGPYVERYPSGGVAKRGEYIGDQLHGVWTSFDPAGNKLSQRSYDHDVADGVWKQFGATGVAVYELNWVQGKRDGAFILRYADGQVALEGSYVDDVEDGTWTHYDVDGRVERVETWTAGERVKVQER